MTEATTTEKFPVQMTDGRTVLFNKRQKLAKESTIDEAAGTIVTRLDFRNGETRTYSMRSDLILRFAAHGAEQKLGDIIAGEADEDDQVLAVDALIARLDAGDWTQPRKAGEFAGTSVIMKALLEADPTKTVEQVKAFLSTKTAQEKTALRRSTKLRPIVERLEAEKASRSKTIIDADALLADFGLSEDKPAKK